MMDRLHPNRYTMLLGRPPFETTNLKETYRCIREARYSMPSSLSPQAKHLISSMLSKNPMDRPQLDDILRHDFFCQVCVSLWKLNCLYEFPHNEILTELDFVSAYIRVSHQTDCLLTAAMQPQTFTTQALPKASSRKPQPPCLVERRTKPSTWRFKVSTFNSSLTIFALPQLHNQIDKCFASCR